MEHTASSRVCFPTSQFVFCFTLLASSSSSSWPVGRSRIVRETVYGSMHVLFHIYLPPTLISSIFFVLVRFVYGYIISFTIHNFPPSISLLSTVCVRCVRHYVKVSLIAQFTPVNQSCRKHWLLLKMHRCRQLKSQTFQRISRRSEEILNNRS